MHMRVVLRVIKEDMNRSITAIYSNYPCLRQIILSAFDGQFHVLLTED